MKIERFAFTPSNSISTVILSDTTLTADRFIFWIESPYQSHGYDDMTRQIANYGTATNVKNDRSIYVHNGSSAVISGRVTSVSAGEFDVTFDSYAANQIKGIAIED